MDDNWGMFITTIHHVQLAMPRGREPEAVAFYEGVLGIPEVPKPEHLRVRGGCWFESANVRIHIGVEDDFRPARKAHPALEVADLESFQHRINELGVETSTDQPLPGYDRCYIADPFGNRIELLQRLTD